MTDFSEADANDFLRSCAPDTNLKLTTAMMSLSQIEMETVFDAVRNFEFRDDDPNTDHDFGVVKPNCGGVFYFSFDGAGDAKVLTIGKVSEFS